MTPLEHAPKVLAEELGLWPSPKNLGIITRHLTSLIDELRQSKSRYVAAAQLLQESEDENKRLRRHVVSFLSMIENGILTYPEHHESRVKYTTDKAKSDMEQALTKPT